MDEIDAALDFRNVSIIANYIKSKTEAAQLCVHDKHGLKAARERLTLLRYSIIISLRNDMFELSHRLVGIYKTNNVSRVASSCSNDF